MGTGGKGVVEDGGKCRTLLGVWLSQSGRVSAKVKDRIDDMAMFLFELVVCW